MRLLTILFCLLGGCVHDDLDAYYARWTDHVNYMHDTQVLKTGEEVKGYAVGPDTPYLADVTACEDLKCWMEQLASAYAFAAVSMPAISCRKTCDKKTLKLYEKRVRAVHNSNLGARAMEVLQSIENSRYSDLLIVEREKRRDQQLTAMQFQSTMNSINGLTNTLNNYQQDQKIKNMQTKQTELEQRQDGILP